MQNTCMQYLVISFIGDIHLKYLRTCNHLDEDEGAGCFALFVFLVSHDCCVALPHDATVCLQFVIVVFPDHTHLLFLIRL